MKNEEKDAELSTALADKYVQSVDQQSLAVFLLTKEVATSLLARRLRDDPHTTVAALLQMPRRKELLAAARPQHNGKSSPMSREATEKTKQKVLQFLSRNGWSTRKQLMECIGTESVGVYRRIVGELQAAKELTSRGDKGKREYNRRGR